MDKDIKIVLSAVLILLVSMVSFSFFDVSDITGKATSPTPPDQTIWIKYKGSFNGQPQDLLVHAEIKCPDTGYLRQSLTCDYVPININEDGFYKLYARVKEDWTVSYFELAVHGLTNFGNLGAIKESCDSGYCTYSALFRPRVGYPHQGRSVIKYNIQPVQQPVPVPPTQLPPTSAPTYKVCVYEHCNYQGKMQCFNIGDYPYHLGIGNDVISSIKFKEPGFNIAVYEHNFNGASKTFSSDVSCLVNELMNSQTTWNDQITSLKVLQTQAQPAPPQVQTNPKITISILNLDETTNLGSPVQFGEKKCSESDNTLSKTNDGKLKCLHQVNLDKGKKYIVRGVVLIDNWKVTKIDVSDFSGNALSKPCQSSSICAFNIGPLEGGTYYFDVQAEERIIVPQPKPTPKIEEIVQSAPIEVSTDDPIVCVYEHCNFEGRGECFYIGDFPYPLYIGNDVISSIKFNKKGYQLIAFEHELNTQPSRTIARDVKCLADIGLNDKISSLKVTSPRLQQTPTSRPPQGQEPLLGPQPQPPATSAPPQLAPINCKDGCYSSYNEQCLPYGTRFISENTYFYCGGLGIEKQLNNGASCLNNYECNSNICKNGVCEGTEGNIDNTNKRIEELERELKEQRGILEKILGYISKFF